MNKISHQLKNLSPNWKVKHLFIGTFNPDGGLYVPYFYGREKNLFWKILSEIFNENFNPHTPDFFDLIKKNGIACIDLIESVQRLDSKDFSDVESEAIMGKGYSDSKIINGKIKREYKTIQIRNIIKSHNCNVYSTWGKGSNLKDWKNEINKIQFTANLVSPSPVARVPKGVYKFEYILSDWKDKIII
jgi:hypothetical protein